MGQKNLDYCDIDSWTVSQIMESLTDKPKRKKRIIIPRYQRSLVWSDDQRAKFIESITKGFPTGSLLLYNRGMGIDGFEQYSLVDGLQRVSTLKRHEDRRTQYFLDSDVPPELCNELVEELSIPSASWDNVQQKIGDWVRRLTSFEEVTGYSAYALLDALCDAYGAKVDPAAFKRVHSEIVAPFLKEVKDSNDISDLKIPLIIYNGPEHELPEIFARLNHQGTQLSKYQIYAALWSHHEMNIANAGIVTAVKRKYDSIINQGMTVDGYDPDDKVWASPLVPLTSFEYVYGLGKWLAEKYPGIFSSVDANDPNTTDSIAFNLCTTCLGLKISDMDKLPDRLKTLSTGRFEECLVDSIVLVRGALLPITRLKLNAKDSDKGTLPSYYHTEFQVVSMIGRCFRAKYSPLLEIQPGWEDHWAYLEKYFVHHYLFDVLRHVWAGTGDKQVDELVKETSRYERPIYAEAWAEAFRNWFENELGRKERSRNLRNEDVLFLRYIYAHKQSAYDDAAPDHVYQVEHLAPVARLRSMDTTAKGLPINCVGNLALLPQKLNNRKKEMTISEFYDVQVAHGKLKTDEAQQQERENLDYALTSRVELTMALSGDIDGYEAFLKARFARLQGLFMSLNRIENEPKS